MTIKSASPDQTLLSLKEDVFYVAIMEPITGTTMGKIISVDQKRTYDPKNKTTALLLYLLPGAGEAPILLRDFLGHAKAAFNGAKDNDIHAFLDKLEKNKIIDITAGTAKPKRPNRLNEFLKEVPKQEWEKPDFVQGPVAPRGAIAGFSMIVGRFVPRHELMRFVPREELLRFVPRDELMRFVPRRVANFSMIVGRFVPR